MKNKWSKVKLGDILNEKNDFLDINKNKLYRELTLRLYGNGFEIRREVAGDQFTIEMHNLKNGDFVTSIHQFRNGAVGIVPKELEGCTLSKNFLVFSVKNKLINPDLLVKYLSSPNIINYLQKYSTGSATPIYSRKKILEFEIPLPSLSEQKHIVKKISTISKNIEDAKKITEKNLQNSSEIFEAYLQKIMNLNNHKWKSKKLGEICKFQGGSQPPKAIFSYQKKEGYIRLIQIRDYKSDKYIVYIPKEKARRFCSSDDVMIGRYGPPLFQILRGLDGAYNVALMKVIPDKKEILNDYLYFFLRNKNIQHYVINLSSRSAGQTGVNKKTLEPYQVSYPSIRKQEAIIKNLDKISEQTRKLEEICKKRLYNLEELKKSIFVEAFNGEL